MIKYYTKVSNIEDNGTHEIELPDEANKAIVDRVTEYTREAIEIYGPVLERLATE